MLKLILFVAVSCLVTGKPHRQHGNHGHHYGWHKHDPQHHTDQFIVGGTETARHQYPFMAALLLKRNDFQFCGGSLINEWQVVTAAHCINRGEENSVVVGLGLHDKRDTGLGETDQVMAIASIERHQNYNTQTLENDIAMITFRNPAVLDQFVQPVQLATQNYAGGTTVTAIGWGALRENGATSNTLQHVDKPLVDRSVCNSLYGGSITENMLCAGEKGKDACQGDSGGPLVERSSQELIGITSWGYGCAREGYPGVYADVAYFLNWIESRWQN